jgi:hypothetical protein
MEPIELVKRLLRGLIVKVRTQVCQGTRVNWNGSETERVVVPNRHRAGTVSGDVI